VGNESHHIRRCDITRVTVADNRHQIRTPNQLGFFVERARAWRLNQSQANRSCIRTIDFQGIAAPVVGADVLLENLHFGLAGCTELRVLDLVLETPDGSHVLVRHLRAELLELCAMHSETPLEHRQASMAVVIASAARLAAQSAPAHKHEIRMHRLFGP
jgi:hypothetical protein